MFNPLLPDLSKLKTEDIDNKILELNKKYLIAARSGHGHVCQQISIIIDAYKDEQRKRFHESNQKLQEKTKNLDDFINVDR